MLKFLPYSISEHQRIGTMLKDLRANIITSQINMVNQLGKTKARASQHYKQLKQCERACDTLKNYLEELMLCDHPDDNNYPDSDPLSVYYNETKGVY